MTGAVVEKRAKNRTRAGPAQINARLRASM